MRPKILKKVTSKFEGKLKEIKTRLEVNSQVYKFSIHGAKERTNKFLRIVYLVEDSLKLDSVEEWPNMRASDDNCSCK